MRQSDNPATGFTLVEAMIVCAPVGLLGVIAVPSFGPALIEVPVRSGLLLENFCWRFISDASARVQLMAQQAL